VRRADLVERETKRAQRTMMRPEEVAERWGVNIKTVYASIRAGQLPALRLGRTIRIPATVVASIEKQGRVAPPKGDPDGDSTR
jgi:excisionase family DNA binding protein